REPSARAPFRLAIFLGGERPLAFALGSVARQIHRVEVAIVGIKVRSRTHHYRLIEYRILTGIEEWFRLLAACGFARIVKMDRKQRPIGAHRREFAVARD